MITAEEARKQYELNRIELTLEIIEADIKRAKFKFLKKPESNTPKRRKIVYKSNLYKISDSEFWANIIKPLENAGYTVKMKRLWSKATISW